MICLSSVSLMYVGMKELFSDEFLRATPIPDDIIVLFGGISAINFYENAILAILKSAKG